MQCKLYACTLQPFSGDSCSDTDSGICTDNGSECQQSPKCSTTTMQSSAANATTTFGQQDFNHFPKVLETGRGRAPKIAVMPP
jgi:hypothetical protein